MLSVHKNLLVFLFVGIFLVSTIPAELIFKENSVIDLKIVCINAGFCSAAAQCNVSIFDPNENVILSGVESTQSSNLAFFNI
ncbi:hypothetical protein LCGC14_1484600, partial [marine sediment metagenome]